MTPDSSRDSGSAGSYVWDTRRTWPPRYVSRLLCSGAARLPLAPVLETDDCSACQCASCQPSFTLPKRVTLAPPMAVGVDRRAKKVASRLDHALLLEPVGNAMPYDPLTQISGPTFPVPETTTLSGREGQFEYISALSGQASDPASQPASKKRRSSKDRASTSIRRSSSTPHMRNLALGTTGDLSPTGDKRRNKLGYHRTSVACGKKAAPPCILSANCPLIPRRRALSPPEDSMSCCPGRADRPLRKLHPSEERMQLLSCRPGAGNPAFADRRVKRTRRRPNGVFRNLVPASPAFDGRRKGGGLPTTVSWSVRDSSI